jgi:hypothetical protein
MRKTSKIIILCFILSIEFVLSITSQTLITLDEVKQAGLHIIEITTNENEEPEGTIIESPIFPGSYNMVYKNKVPCQIVISKDGETLYNSGEYIKKNSGATIRINGNTTAYFSDPLNMPYKLKLEKAADLLCRGNESKYKDKEWRLLKDAVSLNTIIGLHVSQLLELEWTPAYIPCNVIINGDYRGCYLLIETMKRNESCRVNCDKQTGYIIEKDPYWWKEDKYFSSSWYKDDNVYRWTWKYPDTEDLYDEQEAYIKQYIESTEESLANGNYESYIDIESFAKWILVHDIVGTRDSWGSNMYIKKFDNTDNSQLELPCVWDFDSSNDITPGSFSTLHTQENEYFYPLFNSSNSAFVKEYIRLWNSKKQYIKEHILAFLSQYLYSDEAKALDISRLLYNRRFGYTYNTIDKDVQLQQQWYNNHIQLLDERIQLIETKISYINNSLNQQNEIQNIYSITGVEVNKNYKNGIIIYKLKNGHSLKVHSRNIH